MKFDYKSLFILIFTCFVITQVQSQIVSVEKVSDLNTKKLVPNIKSYNRFSHKELGISVLEVTNETGSAYLSESEEVTTDLFIGVSE